MARTVKKGKEIWPLLERLHLFPVVADTGGGQHQTIQPLTRYGSFVYITNDGYSAYYIQGDELKSEKPSVLFRNETIAIMARGGASAAWIVPVYKAMVSFAIYVVPGGKIAGGGVKAFSIAVFFVNHQAEVESGLKQLKDFSVAFGELYEKAPKLVQAMICVLIEEAGGQISTAIKKKGFVNFVLSNMDWEKFAQDAAKFFGALLKAAIGGGVSKVGTWLSGYFTKKGLLKVARLIVLLDQARTVLKFVNKGKNLKPGVKDKEKMAAKLIQMFGETGVTLSKQQAAAIADEEYLSNPQLSNDLNQLKAHCDQLSATITNLERYAKHEIF